MSATLADVAACGVVPSAEEVDTLRAFVDGVRHVRDLHTVEAGYATAAARGFATAVLAGDAARVAYWVRKLCAVSAVCEERADAIVAAEDRAL